MKLDEAIALASQTMNARIRRKDWRCSTARCITPWNSNLLSPGLLNTFTGNWASSEDNGGLRIEDLRADDWYVMDTVKPVQDTQAPPPGNMKDGDLCAKNSRVYVFVRGGFYELGNAVQFPPEDYGKLHKIE